MAKCRIRAIAPLMDRYNFVYYILVYTFYPGTYVIIVMAVSLASAGSKYILLYVN